MNFNGLLKLGIRGAVVVLCFAAIALTADRGEAPAGAAAITKQFKLGEVRVDPANWAITFPSAVNQKTGQVEYLLVHETGKVHESIFRTAVKAQEIHTAALLFSNGGGGTDGAKLKVKTIEVAWTEDQKEKSFNAAELILDKKKKRALRETKWAYRGSRLVDGIFLAERDGSLIGIMQDREALIDQDTPDASDDENWEPIAAKLPASGAAVRIKIVFEKAK
jgi:hypothetical protein